MMRVFLALVLMSGLAEADERPWAAGVSASDQATATELLARGNDLLDQGAFAPALEPYRAALAHWDHPAIRYNLAVALINLERPLEAYAEIEHALRYGEQALEPDVYRQALVYQRLLHAQIVDLAIACPAAGAQVVLDGQALPCRGAITHRVLPGRHALVATRPGYVTRAVEIAPAGGEAPHVELALRSEADATVFHRRWAHWKPWAVVASGAAIAVIGLGVELQSAADYRSYDDAVAVLCRPQPCAALPSLITDAKRDAERDNRIAVGVAAVGGAALVTGVVLVWINRAVAAHLGYEDAPIVSIHMGAQTTVAATIAF